MAWPRGARPSETRNFGRLEPVFAALAEVGVGAEPVLYCDEESRLVREQLIGCDGVLVWVDPIDGGETREVLDDVLREVAAAGVWVSAHPDVIDAMGTKEVLYRTRGLGWGTDTELYRSAEELRARFPRGLAAGLPRVLKQRCGNGGLGVWKVTVVTADGDVAPSTMVRVQHAAPRDDSTERVSLERFMERCEQYFAGSGTMVDQPFIAGVVDGMVRAYLVGGTVVGYARQQPEPSLSAAGDAADRVLGMPSGKTMFDVDEPRFASLRRQLEPDWVPGLCRTLGLAVSQLPLLWDADFLIESGVDADREPSYVLCEINVSSVLPFPPAACGALAAAVRR